MNEDGENFIAVGKLVFAYIIEVGGSESKQYKIESETSFLKSLLWGSL